MNSSPLRHFLLSVATLLFVTALAPSSVAISQPTSSTSVQQQLVDLEASSGGHLGVAAINTANNQRIDYHAEERFPFCSTFKVMVVGGILKQSMTDRHFLSQQIFYTQQEVERSGYAPITKNHLATGMTISELCAAALCYSDNNAANLLIKQLGGLGAVTAFARSIGDASFRLDRQEPELNSGVPGDLRDTSTPAAMAKSLQNLALGNALGVPQHQQLLTWMKNNTTGEKRIRAGVPKGWSVAEKTGSGAYGITNDIGIIWPPGSAPIIVAIYFSTQDQKDNTHHDDIIAAATRILINRLMDPEQEATLVKTT
jgi:beta-lactamase class A